MHYFSVYSVTRQSNAVATGSFAVIAAAAFVRAATAGLGAVEAALAAAVTLVTGAATVRAAERSGILGTFSSVVLPLFGVAAVGIAIAKAPLPASVAALCVAAGMAALMNTLRRHGRKNPVLCAALCFGAAPLLSPPCVLFALLLPMAMAIYPLSWRQSVIALAGWCAPLLAVSYIDWLGGGNFTDTLDVLAAGLGTGGGRSWGAGIAAGAVALALAALALTGVVKYAQASQNMLVRVRRAVVTVYAALAVAVAAAIIFPAAGVGFMPVTAVPASLAAAFALDRSGSRFAEAAYATLLALFAVRLVVG